MVLRRGDIEDGLFMAECGRGKKRLEALEGTVGKGGKAVNGGATLCLRLFHCQCSRIAYHAAIVSRRPDSKSRRGRNLCSSSSQPVADQNRRWVCFSRAAAR